MATTYRAFGSPLQPALQRLPRRDDELRRLQEILSEKSLGISPELVEARALQPDAVLELEELHVRGQWVATRIGVDAVGGLEPGIEGGRLVTAGQRFGGAGRECQQ